MIKLFGKIRKNLLAEGKTSNYIKYAIGEIVLVVIGIMIALQVNNWNENRKLQIEHVIFLDNIKQDLTNDLEQLNKIIGIQSQKKELINLLKTELKNEKSKNIEKIEQIFSEIQASSNLTFFPNTGAYSTSSSSGIIATLKPESLKIAITNLYERYYYRLNYNGEIYDKRVDESSFRQGKFFNNFSSKFSDPDAIDDSEFLNLVSILIFDNNSYLDLSNNTKIEIQNIIKLINKRLNTN